jgi:ferredoxin
MITGLNERFGETNCAACMACANYCPTEAITPKLIIKTLTAKPELKPIAPPLVASSSDSAS